MAAKNYYLTASTADGWRTLSESTQAAATNNDGWVVSTGSTNHSEYFVGVERAAATFSGTTVPDGSLDTTNFDAFRSESALNGDFASGNWVFTFNVCSVTSTSGQDGRIRFRLIKADADGSNAVEITAAQQQAGAITDVASSPGSESALTVNPGAFSITNQYLFVQVAWERTGGASMTNADVNWRTGSATTTGTRIVTSDFTLAASNTNITPTVGSLVGDGIASLVNLTLTGLLTGAMALTGVAPEFALGMTFEGQAPTVIQNNIITPTAGGLTATGVSSTLIEDTILSGGVGSLTLTGVAPTVSEGESTSNEDITPTVGSLAITGTSSVLDYGLNGTVGSLTFTGISSVLDLTVPGSVGSLSLSGIAPTVSDSGSAVNTNLTPLTGSLFFGDSNEPSTASLDLVGYAPTVRAPLTPDTAQALTLTGSAPTVSVSFGKSWYLTNTTGDGWRTVSESLQAAATSTDGWIVATGAVNTAAYNVGVERPATSFVDAIQPDGTLDTVLKDAFRSETSYLGTFAAGNWDAHFVVRAVTSATGQDGRIRFRLFKADADGSNAIEITSGQQACSILTNVSSGSDNDSFLTFAPGTFSVTNQYLFFQIAWERTGGATMANADINWRTGSALNTGTRINAASFTDGDTSVTHTPATASLVLTGIAPGVSESAGSSPTTITPNTGELFFGDVQSITPQTGTLVLQDGGAVGSPQIQPFVGTLTLEGQNAGFNQASITPGTGTLKCMQWAKIAWEANTEPDLAGYIVRWGTTSGTYPLSVNVNNVLFYVWEDLPYGTNYFVVDAYDASNNISLHSSEVSTFISGGGWAPTAERGTPVTPTVGSLTLTGAPPTAVEAAPPSLALSPLTGVLSLTEVAPSTAFTITPDAGALTISGVAPAVTSGDSPLITPVKGTLTLTGIAPTVFMSEAQLITPAVASLSLAGIAGTLSHSITPTVGALAFTQTNKEPVVGLGIVPFTGSIALSIEPSTLSFAVQTDTGTLTLTGTSSLLSLALQPSVGALTFTSDQPIAQVPGNTSLVPFAGSLTLTGLVPAQDVTIIGNTGELDLIGRAIAPANVQITPSAGTLTIAPANAGAFPRVRVTPLPCYPRWSRSNTWGGHSWCAHRNIAPYRTDQLNALVYYLQVDIEQSSASDFVIAQITPILNINAQLPDKYQAFVDEDGFERLSVEIVSGSSDDFVIQSIRPVMNLKKQRRHS